MKYPQIHPVLFLLNQRWNATTRPVCGWRIWIVFQRLAEETSCTFAAMNDASWKKFSCSWSQHLGLHAILQRQNDLQLLHLVWVTVTIRNNQLFHFSMDNLRLYLLFIFPIISDVIFFSHRLISSVSFFNSFSHVEWTALKQVKLKTLQKYIQKSLAVGGRVVRFSFGWREQYFYVISRLTVLRFAQ